MSVAVRVAGALLPDLVPRAVGQPGPVAFADPEVVRTVLGASAWGGVDIKPIDIACTLPARDLTYLTQIGPVAKVLPTVDAGTRARVVGALRQAYEPFVSGDIARYTAACWAVEATAQPR